MTPRNVLHIVTQLELGGAQRSTLQLLARLDRRKFAPALISSDGPLTHAARALPGVPVMLLPSLRRAIHPLADALALAQLTTFIRRGAFDLVHTHSSKAGILGRWAAHAAKRPAVVHTIHGFGFHPYQSALVRTLYQRVERMTARITDGFIAVSERDRQTGVRLGIGTPAQYRLIRYGIETGRFGSDGASLSVRQALGIAPEEPVVGTVACLKPQKAPLDFVAAFHQITQRIPNAHGILIGDGPLRPEVERLRDRLGLGRSLHLLGWREDVPRLLGAMDVFLLTSRWEGLPIACLEAMAAGLPIVATTAGGIPELVTPGENGWLVPAGQPHRLASAVVQLLEAERVRARMGARNRHAMEGRFTIEQMVAETERFYEALLEPAS